MNILITGAGKGIGYATALKFIETAKSEDNIFLLSRDLSQIKNISTSKPRLHFIECDLINTIQLNERLKIIYDNCQSLDFIINNAGLLLNKDFNEIKEHEIDHVLNTNFKAPFLIIQQLMPLLVKAKNPHIINIASMGGFQGATKFSGLSVYSSSKAALVCLTECLAEEFKSIKIAVNALCIGAVQTEMLSEAFPGYKALLSPNDMASYLHWFTLNGHKYFNGKVIPVSNTTP